LKLSAIVALNNTGWPISHYLVLKWKGNCKSFMVNQRIQGSNLAKVIFGMKNPSVIIVRSETAVDKINLDALKQNRRVIG
jgi:hypothetical protein